MDEETELQKLRVIARRCADVPKVKQYVKESAIIFSNLITELGYTPFNAYVAITTSGKRSKYDSGIVSLEDIDDMLKSGNIREHSAFIFTLVRAYPNLIPILIIKQKEGGDIENANINSPLLTEVFKKVQTYTGLTESSVIEVFQTCVSKKENCKINTLTSVSVSESAIISRYDGFPIRTVVRATRTNNLDLYKITPKILYPPLSQREIRFLKKYRNYNDRDLPIRSGGLLYQTNDETYFKELCSKYNEFTVCGPSTSIDILYHSFALLKNWNIELFILANIAYMCNTPDHSLIELLIPCREYGLEYSVDSLGGSYAFVESLLSKYNAGKNGKTKKLKRKNL